MGLRSRIGRRRANARHSNVNIECRDVTPMTNQTGRPCGRPAELNRQLVWRVYGTTLNPVRSMAASTWLRETLFGSNDTVAWPLW